MSSPRRSPAAVAPEAGTPLPPSPPSAPLDETRPLDEPLRLNRKREREVSLEPTTPKPEDADTDPLNIPHKHAHKRNRLQPIGDDEDGAPRDGSPPAGSPTGSVLSSSPRFESNVRNMNRGVRKLNVREKESTSRTRRRRRGSNERDNRSSGSGSPRQDDDEDMEPKNAASAPSATTEPSAARVASTSASAPTSPVVHVGDSNVPSPTKRRPASVEPMEAVPSIDTTVRTNGVVPKSSGDVAEAHDESIPSVEHEATDVRPLSDPEPELDHDMVVHVEDTSAHAPAPATPAAPPTLLAPIPVTESHKRPRSEEPEVIGRPRSPPPPVPTTSLKSPFAGGGFAAFATNPMQPKSSKPLLWSTPSASTSFAAASSAVASKPSGFSSWASPSPSSVFSSPTPSSSSIAARFTSNFSYKNANASPSPFALPLTSTSVPKPEPPPPMNVSAVPGGGFGAFSSASGFSKFTRPTSPPGSSGSSVERQPPKEEANGTSTTSSSDEDSEEKDGDASFGEKLKAECGPTESSDEEKIEINKQDVATGEENEDTVYHARARLFAMGDNHQWKERGVGTFKINVQKSDRSCPRLVMRSEAVFRLILNEPIFQGMSFSVTDSTRTVTFGGAPKDGIVPMYTLRFGNAKAANDARDNMMKHVPKKHDSLADSLV